MTKYFCFVLFLISNILLCQDIITDRPDLTTAPSIIMENSFQIETGSFVELDQKINNWTIVDNLFRYGLSENLELRVALACSRITLEDNVFETGISNLNGGFKYRFMNEDIQLAYIGNLIIPVGNENFTNGNFGFGNIVALQHNIGNVIEMCYNIGYEYEGPDASSMFYSAISSLALADKLGWFLELYGSLEKVKDNSSFMDSGFTYLLNSNLQIDVSAGLGLTNKYYFLSAGLSLRLPQ